MSWRQYQATLQRAESDTHQRREALRRVTFICLVVVIVAGVVSAVIR